MSILLAAHHLNVQSLDVVQSQRGIIQNASAGGGGINVLVFSVSSFLSIISKLEWAVLLFISLFRERRRRRGSDSDAIGFKFMQLHVQYTEWKLTG